MCGRTCRQIHPVYLYYLLSVITINEFRRELIQLLAIVDVASYLRILEDTYYILHSCKDHPDCEDTRLGLLACLGSGFDSAVAAAGLHKTSCHWALLVGVDIFIHFGLCENR